MQALIPYTSASMIILRTVLQLVLSCSVGVQLLVIQVLIRIQAFLALTDCGYLLLVHLVLHATAFVYLFGVQKKPSVILLFYIEHAVCMHSLISIASVC